MSKFSDAVGGRPTSRTLAARRKVLAAAQLYARLLAPGEAPISVAAFLTEAIEAAGHELDRCSILLVEAIGAEPMGRGLG